MPPLLPHGAIFPTDIVIKPGLHAAKIFLKVILLIGARSSSLRKLADWSAGVFFPFRHDTKTATTHIEINFN